MNTSSRGFIALISIIIMSVVLLASTLSLAQFGIASRYFVLDLENKNVSEKLAEACVHMARIHAYNDPLAKISTTSEPVGDASCLIMELKPNPASTTESIIKTRAWRPSTASTTAFAKNDSVTSLYVVVDNNTGDFHQWSEF